MNYSVVIPVYNTPLDILNRAIKSITGYKDRIQIIVVNDGSTKISSEDYLSNLKSFNEDIYYVHLPVNKGSMYARCIGTELSVNDYTLFLDSNDTLRYGFIYDLDEMINSNKGGLIYQYLTDWDEELLKNNSQIFKTPPEGQYSGRDIHRIFYSGKKLQTYITRAVRTDFMKDCNKELLSYCKNTKICLGDDRLMMVSLLDMIKDKDEFSFYVSHKGLYEYSDASTSGKENLSEDEQLLLYDKLSDMRSAIKLFYDTHSSIEYTDYNIAFPQIYLSICKIPRDKISNKLSMRILEEFGKDVFDKYNEENNNRLK